MTTTTDRYLKQLPEGWEKTERGYILHVLEGSCELIRDGKLWITVNMLRGAKWAQSHPSFKQALASLTGHN
jgi:hypothetical protein